MPIVNATVFLLGDDISSCTTRGMVVILHTYCLLHALPGRLIPPHYNQDIIGYNQATQRVTINSTWYTTRVCPVGY